MEAICWRELEEIQTSERPDHLRSKDRNQSATRVGSDTILDKKAKKCKNLRMAGKQKTHVNLVRVDNFYEYILYDSFLNSLLSSSPSLLLLPLFLFIIIKYEKNNNSDFKAR